MSVSRSSQLKDFDVLDRLGSGSFGTVFKVRRLADERLYVIKTVRVSELSVRERHDAINEVKILAQLDSPYVVRYFDSFMEDESLHIVMEYCNRGDLQSLVRKAKDRSVKCLKEHVTWDLTLQIILGLYYLHSKKILHRDLKSANVFLMKQGKDKYFGVKIGDLGVAKLLETSTAFAQTIVGTPYYLSPELCADKPYRDKSDCWALGVLLYECCTLKHPFEARNQCALIMKIMQAQVVPPSRSAVSAELSALCLWLLRKDPEMRPTVRDILCESVVRRKLEEHELLLPQELRDNVDVTDRLSDMARASPALQKKKSQRSMTSDASASAAPMSPPPAPAERDRLPDRPGSTSNANASASASASANTTAAASSSVGSAGGAIGGGHHMGAAGPAVTGNRVRGGGVRAQRTPSKTAMERYQVKPSAAEKTRQVQRQAQQMDRISGNGGTSSSGSRSGSGEHKDAADAETKGDNAPAPADQRAEALSMALAESKLADDSDSNIVPARSDDGAKDGLTESKLADAGGPVVVIHGNEEEEEYEDDFEAVGDEVSEGDGADDDEDDDEDEDGAEDLNSDTTSLKMLHSLAREARHKSLLALGNELFERVYRLCAKHMEAEEAAAEGTGGAAATLSGSTILADLEDALCQHLHGGVDRACEAVFNVKIILALESKIAHLGGGSIMDRPGEGGDSEPLGGTRK